MAQILIALSLAQDCSQCHDWGTAVTPDGHHELCLACRHATSEDIDPGLPEETVDRASAHP